MGKRFPGTSVPVPGTTPVRVTVRPENWPVANAFNRR
jgi:hypothetical protein